LREGGALRTFSTASCLQQSFRRTRPSAAPGRPSTRRPAAASNWVPPWQTDEPSARRKGGRLGGKAAARRPAAARSRSAKKAAAARKRRRS